MEAKELRIGNWVLVENDHETIKAITQTAFLCVLDGKGDGYMQLHKDVYPIPLTEEWLIKFGFERWNDVYNFYHKLNGVEIENGNIYVGHGNEIKYVHQLQNLYFALTNKELTI